MSPTKVKDYLVDKLGCKHMYTSSADHTCVFTLDKHRLDGLTIMVAFASEGAGDLVATHVHVCKQIDTLELDIDRSAPIEPQLNFVIISALFQ